MKRPSPQDTALICLGALGLWLGFPNPLLHLPPLALLHPAALCLLGMRAQHRVDALRRGWLCGLLGAAACLYWLALPVHDVGGMPWLLAAPCAVGIGAYVGLYSGLFCVLAHVLRHRPPLALGLMLGILWYFLELLRGTLFTGFPWLTLATAFAPWPHCIQAADTVGAYALGGILAAAACLLALTPRSHAALGMGVLLLAAIVGYGSVRLHHAPPPRMPAAPLAANAPLPPDAFRLIMVEGNIDQNQKWEPALQQSTVDTYCRLSAQALTRIRERDPHASAPLIIWPETAMPFYFQTHPIYGPQVSAFAKEAQAPLLLGAPGAIRQSRSEFQIFNRAYLVTPQGLVRAWYDKTHLVPFGEYLPPWLAFDFLKPLLQGVGDFTPGVASAPLHTGDLALGMLICYESIFPEIARQRVADGANVLVNISNDGWFGDSAAPEQHLQLAMLRAVEQRRWLVRSTNTGISAIVDAQGRLVFRGAQFKAQALIGTARRITGHSPFFYTAPWLPYGAALLLAVLLCLPRRRAATANTEANSK